MRLLRWVAALVAVAIIAVIATVALGLGVDADEGTPPPEITRAPAPAL
jgi:hypothetical protein